MDWSVLTDPDANLGDDARAALAGLKPDTRSGLSQGLGTIVNKKLAEMIHPWFSKGMRDWADVDVYAAEMREGTLVLHFIADHYNYNFAQSGSDWADHYVFVGEAHLVGGKRKRESFALERHVHLTEHEHDDYDRRKIIETVRAEMHAKLRSETPSRAAFEKAVADVRASSDARSAEANRKAGAAAAVAAPSPSEPTYRCPKCRSDQVGSTLLYDAYQLKCASCGHSQVFETYPEQESDGDWLG
jgi:hypothetical protein